MAAATVNKNGYKSLTNAQNIERAVSIYSGRRKLTSPEKPTLIILAGSPAVGKTTQAARILGELGEDINNYYNVSLDSIVEAAKPYRNATRRLFNNIKDKHHVHEHMGKISGLYLTAMQSKRNNFGVTNPEKNPINRTKRSLNDIRTEAFRIGVERGYNIIYDTTLTVRNDKIFDILSVLDKHSEKKYKILVLLISAKRENIEERVIRRQEAMIADPSKAIRGIPFEIIPKFIVENKEAFDKAETFYKSGAFMEKLRDTKYNPDDFTFMEIENPTVGGRRRSRRRRRSAKTKRRGRLSKYNVL